VGTGHFFSSLGVSLSLLLHGAVAAVMLVGFAPQEMIARTPEVLFVSLAPVALHGDEPSHGSELGVVTEERIPLPAEAQISRVKPKQLIDRARQAKPLPLINTKVESRPTSQAKLLPRDGDSSGAESASQNFVQPRLGQGGSAQDGSGNYEILVVSHLTRAKQYPERARRRGLEGDVVIDLVLDRDGSVRRSIIAGNSPWEILDLEALRMVERAAPFPAPPTNYRPGEAVSFKIPIRFELH